MANRPEYELLASSFGFEWDAGNRSKSWLKHGVAKNECEEVFFNLPHMILPDAKHSTQETRQYLMGKTHQGRLLLLVFTIRTDKIRVISARDANRKEKEVFKTHEKDTEI